MKKVIPVLTNLIIIMLLLIVPAKRVEAFETTDAADGKKNITINVGTVTLNGDKITDGPDEISTADIGTITVTGGSLIVGADGNVVNTNISIEITATGGSVEINAYSCFSKVTVDSTATLKVNNNTALVVEQLIFNGGSFINNGGIQVNDSNHPLNLTGTGSSFTMSSDSSIICHDLNIDKSRFAPDAAGIKHTGMISVERNSTVNIQCTGDFNSETEPLELVGENITINWPDTTAGTITFKKLRENSTVTIDGSEINGRDAYYAYKADLNLTWKSDIPSLYKGQNVNVNDYVLNYLNIPADYDGTIEVVWEEEPDLANVTYSSGDEYDCVVTGTGGTKYKDGQTGDSGTLMVEYYPTPSGKHFSLKGITNGKYVKDSVTLSVIDGYEARFTTISEDRFRSFATAFTLKETDLRDEYGAYKNNFSVDAFYELRDAENKGTTRSLSSFPNEVQQTLMNLVFDAVEPSILGNPIVDGNPVAIEEGAEVKAEEVTISVIDQYLDKVEDSEGNIYTEENGGIVEGDGSYTAKVVLKADKTKVKTSGFVATDKAGNKYTFTFSLIHPEYSEKVEEEETPKETAEAKVLLTDQFFGVDYKPTLVTKSDGASKAIFRYKDKNKPFAGYTVVKPSAVGEYTVQAVVPATTKYAAIACETDFKIVYLATPEDPYSVSGIKGDNDFYIGKVGLTPVSGFAIATTPSGSFAKKVIYNEDVTKVYLSRISDGATTAAIKVKPIKYDDEKPEIYGSATAGLGRSINLSDGTDVYTDELSFTISDKYLDKVTVNKTDKNSGRSTTDTYQAEDGKCKIRVTSDGGKRDFDITARDLAGNVTKFSFRTKASWLESRKIPFGSQISLESGTSYKLGSGTWTVTGDNTIYKGGRDIYVVSSGDYTFNTKQ